MNNDPSPFFSYSASLRHSPALPSVATLATATAVALLTSVTLSTIPVPLISTPAPATATTTDPSVPDAAPLPTVPPTSIQGAWIAAGPYVSSSTASSSWWSKDITLEENRALRARRLDAELFDFDKPVQGGKQWLERKKNAPPKRRVDDSATYLEFFSRSR